MLTNLDASGYKISLSIKAMEEAIEKEAMEKYGSKDSGASLEVRFSEKLWEEKQKINLLYIRFNYLHSHSLTYN